MIEHIEKRALALLLAVLMVFSMVPTQASAASSRTETGSIGNIGWSATITTTTDGETDLGSVTVDGTTMTITAQAEAVSGSDCSGNKTWSYNQKSTELTFTNSGSSEAIISFDYNPGNKVEINGTEYTAAGSYASGNLAAGGTVTVKFYSPDNGDDTTHTGNSATLTLTNIKWTENAVRSLTVKPGTNGTVSVAGTAITADKTQDVAYAVGLAVSAAPASGYKFLAWVDENNTVLATTASATLKPEHDDMVVNALFVPTSENGHWIGNKKIFTEFQDALDAAASGDKIVKLMDNASLTKDYTIPAGVSVLIPFDQALTAYGNSPEVVERPSSGPPTPKVYCTLTMAAGVTLTVNGSLEVGAKHVAAHGGQIDGGRPWEYYGYISMGNNSHINIQSGGNLYAWGYITGSGKVTANSGATIYEKFMIGDYRGGGITSIIVPANVFPFNQYYVQNVEVQETIYPGAKLICHAGLYLSELTSASINFIGGTESMFSIASGTVTKRYDNATDRLIIDMNGNGAMNPISLMDYNTGNFVLPVNHNITVNINSGVTQVNQDLMLQPGAQVNVGREGYLFLAGDKKVYLIDKDNWGNYCFGKPMQQISYVPLKGAAPNIRTADNMTDARVNLDGTAVIQGQLYATTAGALIESVGKTGVVILMNNAPSGTTNIKQSTMTNSRDPQQLFNKTTNISVGAALLTNGDGTTVNTSGAAQYTTYVYDTILDKWVTTAVSITPTLTYNANGGNGVDRALTINFQNTGMSFRPLSQVVDGAGTFSREGAVFTGWNTAADGSGKSFAPGDFITISQNTTLFAQWRNTSATVSFAANAPEGTTAQGQMNSQTLILDGNGNSEFEVPACGYTVDGYTFDGWLGSDGNYYVVGQVYTVSGDLTLTAQWTKSSVVITFNPNAPAGTTASGAMADQFAMEGDKLSTNAFTVTGYTFVGWNTKADGTGTAYADAATAPTVNTTLYAQWKINTHTVTFTVNGEYYAKAEVKYGQSVTAPEFEIPEGHTFSGWTVPDTMPAEDITLDAALTVNVYELSIFIGDHVDENGVCFTEISLQVPYGALLKDYLVETPDFIANTDDRQGKYTFAYWHTYASNVALDTETATMPANYIRYYATYDYTGWYIEEGGKYFVDHQEPIAGWFCVNDKNELVTDDSGDWYYIDPYRDYTNTGVSRAPYPAEAINGITYAPDQEFMDYWKNNYGYFIDEEEAWFIFDEDGKFQYAETGMGTYLDETRYAVNGMLPWHVGLVQIGEDYYYFIGDTEIGGNIMATGNVSMIRNNTDLDVVKSGVYTYGADGKLLKADGITDVNGTLYYYEDYQLMIGAGLIKIDEDYYYVRSNGALVVNSEYWVGGNSFGIAQGMHWFDENGKLTMLGYANVNLGAEDAVFVDAEGNPITCIYAESAVHNNITLTNHPTRVGYTFLGWLVDGSEYLVYTNEETGKQEVSLHLEYNSTATALWKQDVYTITFEDGKGNVLLSEGYTYGQMPTAPANPTRADEDGYKFIFAGWSPTVVEATEDAVYVATWTKTRITYTVNFDTNGDGIIDVSKTVAHGDAPVAPAFSLADTAEWDYTFTGWRDSNGNIYTTLPAATVAETYTAVYTAVKQTYEITWIIDGVSETTTVEYGAMPTHADPSKADTDEYTYTFAGWSPKVVAVTGEATYTAAFTAQKRSYTITWIIDGASETTTVEYGAMPTHADPSKADTAEYTYTFAGWSPEVKAVTGEATYTAEFTAQKRSYEITWIIDGASETTIVEYGVVPTHADPSKAENAQYTYTFAGWSPEVVAVTGEATYTANFTPVLRSYDITFVVDGVEKVVSTKYGETPVYDADGKLPEKAADACYSYTFAGWTPVLEAVTGEATYTATWTEIPVEHTITFMEGDEIIGMITGNYGDAVDMTKVPATDRLGYTFNGWNTMIPDTIPAEDLVINGSWTINQYTITFANDPADDKGEWSYPITKNFGEAITEADIAALNAALPTVTGWEIVGWSDEIPEFMPAHDTAIYAIWEKSVYLVDIYGDDSMGGTLLTSSSSTYGETYETFEIFNASNDFNTDLVREGYVLVGYKYFDGTDVTFPFVQPAHDVQMVAQYVPVEYTIDFMDGDELVTSITAGYGTAITLPENPTKEGFTFAGWVDADGNAVDLSTMPLNGMTVYASWTVDSFMLNFFASEGDTTAYQTFEVTYGTELNDACLELMLSLIPDPVKEGYTWNGWNIDNVPETMPASAVNVYGEWTANTYTIYWKVVENVNGETMGEFSVDFQFGSAITAPEYTAPAGYEVVDVQSYPATMPAEALYLQITIAPKTYTVTFDSCGGTSVDSISAAYLSAITAPAAPTKTGHIFMGWSVDGETVIDFPATMPIDGLNLKAVWQKDTVYITFIIEGVETVKAFAYGDTIVAPEATKAADAKWTYKFVGWDADLPAFATETTTYTALFAEDEAVKYNVKFVDGENVVFETQIAWNDVVTLDGFTAPELTGNTLAWTVDGAAASFPYAMTTADVTFVASWTPITYTVYYYTVDGFENGEPAYTAQATYGAAFPTYTLTLPEGYDFGYWADANGNAYDLPETMPAQDLHLIAQLTPKTFTVTWHYGYDEILEETYAYGATVNGFIPERFYMNTEIHRGWFDHVWWYNMHTSENIDIPFTMPAENLSICSATRFTGWMGNPNHNYFHYIADSLEQQGWFCVNDKNELVTDGSGEWYYAGDDENVVSDITEIEGVYYAFDHNTGAFLGDYTGIYEAKNGDKYYVENGIAVKNKGLVKDVLADGHIHYYYFGCADETCTDALCGGEYKAQRGCGHWAEITNGYLVKWGYVFDEDGVIIHDEDTSKNGVHLDNGVKFYYIDGVKVHKGLFIGDDNEYYYARSDGSLVVDRDYWISESHTNGLTYNGEPIVEGSYTFDAEGRIVWPNTEKNGVYMEGGKLYYYEAGLRTYAGLIRYTGSLYNENGTAVEGVYNNDLIYVRGSGELAIGKYWPTKTNGLMDSNTYQFDKNGKMMMLSGIIAEDGSLYYYEDGLRTYAGLIEINGDFYYVRGTGEVVNGRSYWITKTNGLMAEGTFQFAEDGKMIIPEPVAVKNGIYREDGKLYYYVDGKLNYAGLIRYTGSITEEDGTVIEGVYDNAYIYVRGTGELAVGSYWTTKHNDLMKSATHQFDENGIMTDPAV